MSEELKYPHEWFELLKSEIPQPFRFEIDDNLDDEFKDYRKCERFDFITYAFDWIGTTQDLYDWADVCAGFKAGTLQRHADQVNKERWDALKVGDTLYSITEDGREGIVTEKYLTEALAVLQVGKKDNYIGYENWFNYWTPIKPKHWKEENNRELPIHNEEGEIIANNSEELNEKEQDAIYFLKSLGYKILKPVTNYEEI
jgi:hypothetical protein